MFFKKHENLIYCTAVLFFIIFSVILIHNHEPWRDEAQAWLIARDAPNIKAIVKEMGYEGTPALWHFVLLALVKTGLPYYSMFILHFLLALTCIIVFLKYSPFSSIQKILFIFGYYIFYEYNIIARSYVLVVLFLFIIASLYKYRFEKPIIFSLLIFLLGNSNVFGFILALVISIIYIIDNIYYKIKFNKNVFLSIILIVIGLFLSFYQMLPPDDLQPATAIWKLDINMNHLSVITKAVTGAFFPIPQNCVTFWNTLIFQYPDVLYIGLLIYLLTLMFFIRKLRYLFVYVALSSGLFTLYFLKSLPYLRFYGILYVIFIFVLWISSSYQNSEEIKYIEIINKKVLDQIFIIFLLIQLLASMCSFYYEYKYDFSAGKKLAMYLRTNKYIDENTLIATHPSFTASSVLPYLSKTQKFYNLEYEKFGSYIVWNKEYSNNSALNAQSIIERIDNIKRKRNYKNVLIILNGLIPKDSLLYKKYYFLNSFKNTIVGDESFYIYKLNKKK